MEISDNTFNTSIFFDTNELGFKQITPQYLMKIEPKFHDNTYVLNANSHGLLASKLYSSNINNSSDYGKHLTVSNNGEIVVGNLGNGLEIDSNGNLNAKPLGGTTVGDGLEIDSNGILKAKELGAATVGDGLEIVNGVLKAKSLGTASVGSNLHLDSTTNILDLDQSVLDSINLKAPINNPTFTGTVGGITKSMVNLSNVDNTSDADKPISTATQTALNTKQDTIGDGDLTIAKTSGLQSALDSKQDNIQDGDLTIAKTSGLQSALDSKQDTIADGDLTIAKTSGLQTAIDSKQDTIGDGDLSIAKTSGLQTAIDSKQDTIGDGDLTISNTSGLQTALDSKQDTIADGDLSIAKTNGLQGALDAKQDTIVDGDLTIAKTSGLQGALDSKQDNIQDGDLTIAKTSGLQTAIDAKQDTIGDGDLTIAKTNGLQSAIDSKQDNIADGDLTIAKTSGLQTELDSKVGLTGDETISGSKTFSSEIIGDITGNAATSTTTNKLRINGNDLNLPTNTGSEGQVLKLNETGDLEWSVNEDAIDRHNSIEVKNLNVYGSADISGSITVMDEISIDGDATCKQKLFVNDTLITNKLNINGIEIQKVNDGLEFDKALFTNIEGHNLNISYNTDISNLNVDYINFGNTNNFCQPSGNILTPSGVTIKFI